MLIWMFFVLVLAVIGLSFCTILQHREIVRLGCEEQLRRKEFKELRALIPDVRPTNVDEYLAQLNRWEPLSPRRDPRYT